MHSSGDSREASEPGGRCRLAVVQDVSVELREGGDANAGPSALELRRIHPRWPELARQRGETGRHGAVRLSEPRRVPLRAGVGHCRGACA